MKIIDEATKDFITGTYPSPGIILEMKSHGRMPDWLLMTANPPISLVTIKIHHEVLKDSVLS